VATRVGLTGIRFRVSIFASLGLFSGKSFDVKSDSAVAVERDSIEVDFFPAIAAVGGAVNVGGSSEKSSIESEESFRVDASCFDSISEGDCLVDSAFPVA
jgi:hypothetical protein